ncbi:MAG: hypothetical protein M3Y21_09585 [Candidatus Eremiobacteraeota bacterium]|nr:hypothetical protein [Candidatus Eremiobacteraeota bacterium]
MFLQLDGTAIVQLINFVIFFAILNVVFLRPVGAAIRKRREYINSVTRDYDTYQAQAASLRAQAEALRAGARREAEQTIAAGRAESSNVTAGLSADFSAQVTQTVEAAHTKVAQEVASARTDENKLVRELADLMLDRTLPEAAVR